MKFCHEGMNLPAGLALIAAGVGAWIVVAQWYLGYL